MGMTIEEQRPRVLESWYMDDSSGDQRLPHRLSPNQPVLEKVLEDVGVAHWILDADKFENDPDLENIRKERNYNYQDLITVSPEKLPNYEAKIKSFFEEHIHTDEEIRYVLDGSGYFDVRDAEDRWIRIWTKKGDMIVLPAGLYHRFTLDEGNYIKGLKHGVGWDHSIAVDFVTGLKLSTSSSHVVIKDAVGLFIHKLANHKAMRLFIGEPVWTPYNRPQDDNLIRQKYVNSLKLQAGPLKVQAGPT